MTRYDFLIETYQTERLKTLSVWSQVPDERMAFRPEPRARSPHEHMVHQCLSEEAWTQSMLGIAVPTTALPPAETRLAFIKQYAACSEERLSALRTRPDSWFEEVVPFFNVTRSRAWILTRRLTHSAHHRGQLTVYLRLWGLAVYSTYGPTADTGGLPRDGATTIYRYDSIDDLLRQEESGGASSSLPGVGSAPSTERPGT